MKEVKFKHWNCVVSFAKYGNGRTAIKLTEKETGEPVTVATVNLPEHDIKPGYVFIKDYSENEGVARALEEAGIIGPPLAPYSSGFVTIWLHKLLVIP